jgi:L-rhamnose mutarotase
MRVAWVMKLRSGEAASYKRKHDEIWPELVELIRRDGIRNYSIFRHGLTLFAYYEHDGPSPRGGPRDEIRRRWHEWMAPHMETQDDLRPVVEEVEEVFHLD